ncbi:MGMT family protein [Taklimakanibacter deserti]|uniref:MGMT family protein n=1 Tax=Taklimakanibacter deserti TaxID=2267839 RepID=UPI000E64B641
MGKRKSWAERLADDKNLPLVKPIPPKMVKRSGSGSMVVPAPREVDAAIKVVKKRKLATAREIAGLIARRHGTTVCCPVTTGIFVWIAAHAAHEAELMGRKAVTPYWRVLKNGGELNGKYPGGLSDVKRRLEAEGHVVVRQGQRCFVKDYEKKLAAI